REALPGPGTARDRVHGTGTRVHSARPLSPRICGAVSLAAPGTAVALDPAQEARTMQSTEIPQLPDRPAKERSIFTRLLRGYRFSVCEDAASVARALDVRRQVYRGACGYEVPVPDEYDGRSWLLLAEDMRTGEAVGSMRVTPRAAGPLECEEYLVLPPALRSASAVEITRV